MKSNIIVKSISKIFSLPSEIKIYVHFFLILLKTQTYEIQKIDIINFYFFYFNCFS